MNTSNKPTACAPSLPAQELTRIFIQNKRLVRKYNADAEYLEAIGYACGLLSSNRQDFTQSQFLVLTRSFHEAEPETTRALLNLYQEWLAFMRLHKKIRTDNIFGDEETHRFI